MESRVKATPCGQLTGEWNWKSGDYYIDTTQAGYPITRNYFDCGTYFFDGTFNVVKFPKGMTLYHGSGMLANAVVEFPVGIDYYKPYSYDGGYNIPLDPENDQFVTAVATLDESIEEVVSSFFPSRPDGTLIRQ